jgi:hypothetical protein
MNYKFSRVEKIILCVALVQMIHILNFLDKTEVDGVKFIEEFLNDYYKYRVIMGEHS